MRCLVIIKYNHTIYIMLSHSGSMFSRAIKKCSKDPYTHVSIALDEHLYELYSFGRIKPYNPIIGGFVKEDIVNGTYRRFPETKCAIYSLDISDEQYRRLKKELNKFKRASKQYKYNLIGVVSAAFNKPIHRQHSYFCSQFVSEILQNSGIRLIDKDPGLTSPMDFSRCNELLCIYEGELKTISNGGLNNQVFLDINV